MLRHEDRLSDIKKWREEGLTYRQMAERIGDRCTRDDIKNIVRKRINDPKKMLEAAKRDVGVIKTESKRYMEGETKNKKPGGSPQKATNFAKLLERYAGRDDKVKEDMRILVACEFAGMSDLRIEQKLKLSFPVAVLRDEYQDHYNIIRAEHVQNVHEKYKIRLFHIHERLSEIGLKAVERLEEVIEHPDTPPNIMKDAAKTILDMTIKNTPVSNKTVKTVDVGKEFAEAHAMAQSVVKDKKLKDVLDQSEPN